MCACIVSNVFAQVSSNVCECFKASAHAMHEEYVHNNTAN